MLLFTTAMVLSALPDDATRSFDDGVRAYRREQFAIAERRFAKAASDAPRAVDAWVNLGAAAWEAADTAQAARAWHQALRLDPLDAELNKMTRNGGAKKKVPAEGSSSADTGEGTRYGSRPKRTKKAHAKPEQKPQQ